MRNANYQVVKKLGDLFEENSFLCINKETKETIIVDPATQELVEDIEKNGLKPIAIFLTHAHLDHILHVDFYAKKYGVPLYVHENEQHKLMDPATNLSQDMGPAIVVETPAIALKGYSGKVAFENFTVTYKLYAGHSEGNIGIGIEGEDFLFVGDSVFINSIGRYDLVGSNTRDHHDSLVRIGNLPATTWLLPGHTRRFQVKDLEENMVYQQFIRLGV